MTSFPTVFGRALLSLLYLRDQQAGVLDALGDVFTGLVSFANSRARHYHHEISAPIVLPVGDEALDLVGPSAFNEQHPVGAADAYCRQVRSILLHDEADLVVEAAAGPVGGFRGCRDEHRLVLIAGEKPERIGVRHHDRVGHALLEDELGLLVRRFEHAGKGAVQDEWNLRRVPAEMIAQLEKPQHAVSVLLEARHVDLKRSGNRSHGADHPLQVLHGSIVEFHRQRCFVQSSFEQFCKASGHVGLPVVIRPLWSDARQYRLNHGLCQ